MIDQIRTNRQNHQISNKNEHRRTKTNKTLIDNEKSQQKWNRFFLNMSQLGQLFQP